MNDHEIVKSGDVCNFAQSFPFAVPATTGTTGTTLAAGVYYLWSSVDCWFKALLPAEVTGGTVKATIPSTVAPAGSQPAVNSERFIPAGERTAHTITAGRPGFSVISATGNTGVLIVCGPLGAKA